MKVIFKLRGVLMLPLMVFVTFCTWGEVENETLVYGIGGVAFAVGLALRIWAQMHLHYRLKIRKTLTVTGPYAYVRNPSYLANTILLAAACMLAGMFWFVPIQVLYCGVIYSLVVRYEEPRLTAKYGAPYVEYLAAVPRWLPRWGSWKKGTDMGAYFTPSLLAEVHNFYLLIPFLVKELTR